MHSDRQNARVEHDAALKGQITAALRDNTELYRSTPKIRPSRTT
jgi:hypothetical protein